MDDRVVAFMHAMNDGFPAIETMSAPAARAVIVQRRLPVDNLDDVAAADDRLITGPEGDIPVRIYHPHGSSGTRPAVVSVAMAVASCCAIWSPTMGSAGRWRVTPSRWSSRSTTGSRLSIAPRRPRGTRSPHFAGRRAR